MGRRSRGGGGRTGHSFLPGTSPNVGVTGYTLGGGLSWLGRKYGWACNRVTAIELVTADGEARTVDAATDPDLFWALRGGGGGYAVVTALHVELVPVSEAYAGALLFPPELAGEGIRAYRDWTAGAPEEVGSMVRMLNLPPIPDIPEPLRGKKWLAITAACIGSREEGEKAIAPLREIGEPAVDRLRPDPRPRTDPDSHGPRAAGAGPRSPSAARASCPTTRSTPSSTSPDRSRVRRCCSPSFGTSAERSAGRPRTTARSTSWTPSS